MLHHWWPVRITPAVTPGVSFCTSKWLDQAQAVSLQWRASDPHWALPPLHSISQLSNVLV